MRQEDFLEILNRIADGTASEKDIAIYLEWYRQFKDTPAWWEELQTSPELFKSALFERITNDIDHAFEPRNQPRVISLWPKFAVAASLILLCSITGYFLLRPQTNQQIAQDSAKKLTQPQGNRATLTLANGEKIVLSDARNGQLAQQGAVIIKKSNDGKLEYDQTAAIPQAAGKPDVFNLLTTPRGGRYMIRLPDSSAVLLNAASSLKYPVVFNGSERRVELSGEGYFEVAKNPKKPFVVAVNGRQEVRVLGTHFDISAYDNDPTIRTTLLEGAVLLSTPNRQLLLKPGQMATNNLKGELTLTAADLEEVMAWRKGFFVFNNEKIKDVMRIVARWYDIDVEYQGNVSEKRLWGRVSNQKTLTELLENISYTSGIHYKIAGRRVILMR